MTEMPEEIFIYKAKDSGQIYLLPDYQTTLPHAVKYHRAALQAPQPEVVTETAMTLILGGNFGNLPITNSMPQTWRSILKFLAEKYPHGIRIIREKSDG